jgi:hypothetical protein
LPPAADCNNKFGEPGGKPEQGWRVIITRYSCSGKDDSTDYIPVKIFGCKDHIPICNNSRIKQKEQLNLFTQLVNYPSIDFNKLTR